MVALQPGNNPGKNKVFLLLCSNSVQKGKFERHYSEYSGFPGGSEAKASAYNAGDVGSIPGSGRSPGEGNGNPLQYSCLENPMDGGAWQATLVHGHKESDTTEQLHFTVSIHWVSNPTVNMRTLPLLQALVLGLSELIVVRWPERVTVMPTSTSQLWEGHSKHLGHRQPEGAHVLPFSLSMWRTKRHPCVYMFKSSKTKQWQSH